LLKNLNRRRKKNKFLKIKREKSKNGRSRGFNPYPSTAALMGH
jgi:hypothetical protein